MDPITEDALPGDAPHPGIAGPVPEPLGRSRKHWLPAARAGAVLLAVLLLGTFLVGNALYYQQSSAFPTVGNFVQGRDPEAFRAALAQLGLSAATYAGLMVALQLVFMLGSAAIGLLILFLATARRLAPAADNAQG